MIICWFKERSERNSSRDRLLSRRRDAGHYVLRNQEKACLDRLDRNGSADRRSNRHPVSTTASVEGGELIAMADFSGFWIYDLMCLMVGIEFFNAAVTGNFYSGGRGGRRLIASVKSVPARIAFLFISIAMLVLFAWMTKRHIMAIRLQPFQ
jgi:hypothetical protein